MSAHITHAYLASSPSPRDLIDTIRSLLFNPAAAADPTMPFSILPPRLRHRPQRVQTKLQLTDRSNAGCSCIVELEKKEFDFGGEAGQTVIKTTRARVIESYERKNFAGGLELPVKNINRRINISRWKLERYLRDSINPR